MTCPSLLSLVAIALGALIGMSVEGKARDQPRPAAAGALASHQIRSGGFARLPKIPATHGERPAGHAEVYESSAAGGPYLRRSDLRPCT